MIVIPDCVIKEFRILVHNLIETGSSIVSTVDISIEISTGIYPAIDDYFTNRSNRTKLRLISLSMVEIGAILHSGGHGFGSKRVWNLKAVTA